MKKHSKYCNRKDHENWSRRSFLQALGFIGAGSLTIGKSSLTYAQNSKLSTAIQNTESDRILVIVRLFGGNDGLNTIIPLNQYDLYANARPSLKLDSSDIWNLNPEYAMPNFMNSLESLWGDGKMKVVNSVGYQDHNQSHFKGSQIWSSADTDSNILDTGWFGRYFENQYPTYNSNPPNIPTAIQIGSSNNITFNGSDAKYSFSVSNIETLKSISNTGLAYGIDNLPDCTHGEKLKFMRAMANSTYSFSDAIYEAYNSSSDYTQGEGYNDNDFAQSMNTISRLIKSNLGTKVYMLTLNGFDTHTYQKDAHQELLTTLSDAVSYFYEDLASQGLDDKVLTMTVSEFGRRVSENGSLGTDHGTSCPLLFFGKGLNGNGFVGDHASLETDKLINGFRDLQHHTDFRSVYATVLKQWLCVDEQIVNNTILGGDFQTVDLGFQCTTETITEEEEPETPVVIDPDPEVTPEPEITSDPDVETPSEPNGEISEPATFEPESWTFNSYSFYNEGESYLIIQSDTTQHMVLKLYDGNGKFLGEAANKIFSEGKYEINIKSALKLNLPRGYYIYTLVSNANFTRRKIMIF